MFLVCDHRSTGVTIGIYNKFLVLFIGFNLNRTNLFLKLQIISLYEFNEFMLIGFK